MTVCHRGLSRPSQGHRHKQTLFIHDDEFHLHLSYLLVLHQNQSRDRSGRSSRVCRIKAEKKKKKTRKKQHLSKYAETIQSFSPLKAIACVVKFKKTSQILNNKKEKKNKSENTPHRAQATAVNFNFNFNYNVCV